MNIYRGIAITLTQVPLILFAGAKYDLLFGFNRMDSGFGLLLFLFVSVPLLNLSWLAAEIMRSFKLSRHRSRAAFLMPLFSVAILMESIAIDIYIASYARM